MWYSDGANEHEVKQEEILDAIGIALEECIAYWCEELEYTAAIETNCVYFGNHNCSPYIHAWWNLEDEGKTPAFTLTFYNEKGEVVASGNLSISHPDNTPEDIITELSEQVAQQDADVMSYIASDFGCIASDAINELESKTWRTLMKSIPEKQMAA